MNVDLHNNARISFVTPSPILVYEFPANGFLAIEFMSPVIVKHNISTWRGESEIFAGLFRCQPSQPCRQRTSLVRSIRSMVVAVPRSIKSRDQRSSLATTTKPPLDHRVMGLEISSRSPRTAT
ncbi:hypothetical protein FCV25MIE_26181 [Fagus crenata]